MAEEQDKTVEQPAAEAPASEAPASGTATTTQEPQAPKREAPRGGRSSGRGPRPATDEGESGMEEVVVRIYRCATVVRGGRRFSFGSLVVVGDRNGNVGVGYGKANEVPGSVEKGKRLAARNMKRINLVGGTLPHRVIGRYGASRVVMLPASPGTGVIAGSSVRAVLEMAGVKDVLTKSYGSTSPKNLVLATYDGLKQLLTRENIERLRGVRLAG